MLKVKLFTFRHICDCHFLQSHLYCDLNSLGCCYTHLLIGTFINTYLPEIEELVTIIKL